MNIHDRQFYLVVLYMVFLLVPCTQSYAVNWLMLQGTEHPLAPEFKVWGFVQPAISYDTSHQLSNLSSSPGSPDFSLNNGERLAITAISPWYDDGSRLHLRRAKFGARGIFTGDWRNRFTAKLNYFSLFEVAPNLMTYKPFGERDRVIALDHLSLTFNHISGARIRAGLFKTPGPEETLQAIHTLDYIELTDFSAREVLERYVSGAEKPAGSPSSPSLGVPSNTAYGINAVRDWGIQVFDSFKNKQWDFSYAAMLGRGEAIQQSNTIHDNLDLYLYASAEYDLPGGYGAAKHGLKFYSWFQEGKREFSTDSDHKEFDRIRYGIGARLLGRPFSAKHKYRFATELMFAQGMIFISPVGGVANGNLNNGNLQIAAEDNNKSRAATLDFGFSPDSKWQFDVRLHQHNLLYQTAETVNPGNERLLTETTLGVNYYFSRKLRLTFNYVLRKLEVPVSYISGNGFPSITVSDDLSRNARIISNTVDDRLLLQLTWIW